MVVPFPKVLNPPKTYLPAHSLTAVVYKPPVISHPSPAVKPPTKSSIY